MEQAVHVEELERADRASGHHQTKGSSGLGGGALGVCSMPRHDSEDSSKPSGGGSSLGCGCLSVR